MSEARTLSAPVHVAFDYTRSTGPVLGRYFTALREGEILGARLHDGRIVTPPPEFDPTTLDPVTDFVALGTTGEVISWTWVPERVAGQPLAKPFAFALITLDGASEPFLHALDVDSPGDVSTGMRVQVRWAEERVGAITDIACFVPLSSSGEQPAAEPTALESAAEPVSTIVTPVGLDYLYAASPEESAFFGALAEGKIVGQRCPTCEKVYVPPRGACPTDGVPTTEKVELAQEGTVTTFCVVNVPFAGQQIEIPYVSAYILLDGADIALQHLIQGIPAEDVRMGLRVKAVWKPREEWTTSVANIAYFEPTGEPDADYETYQHHL